MGVLSVGTNICALQSGQGISCSEKILVAIFQDNLRYMYIMYVGNGDDKEMKERRSSEHFKNPMHPQSHCFVVECTAYFSSGFLF